MITIITDELKHDGTILVKEVLQLKLILDNELFASAFITYG